MNPIRFGPPGRELFGIHQAPSGGVDRRTGVLLCNPFGQEAIRSHRLYRVLADRMARDGYHVLRFDYFGTGDSGGDDLEGELDGWIRDALAANDELVRHSGNTRVAWFGLRLGASVAALATSRTARHPAQLVLWDPIIDGTGYLAELTAAHLTQRRASFGSRWAVESRLRAMVSREEENEVLGFPVTLILRRQLDALTPDRFGSVRAAHVFLLAERGRTLTELEARFAANRLGVSARTLDSGIDWTTNEALNSSIVPAEALRRVLESLPGAT